MGLIFDEFKRVFRHFVTDGVISSGLNEPEKHEIQALGRVIEAAISSAASSVARYASLSSLEAVTSAPVGSLAYVFFNNGSAADAANGFYQKSASSWIAAPWVSSQLSGDILAKIEIGGSEISDVLRVSASRIGLGLLAGNNVAGSDFSTSVGFGAGYAILNSPYAVAIGANAADATTGCPNIVALGPSTARNISASANVVVVGPSAAYDAENIPYSVVVGDSAAQNVTDSDSIVAVGASAARHAAGCDRAVFIGIQAGGGLSSDIGATGNVFDNEDAIGIGYAALRYMWQSPKSIGVGYAAMENANRSANAVGVGLFAGIFARQSPNASWLGHGAGMCGEDSPRAIGIGYFAGASEVVNTVYGTPLASPDGVFIGTEAGNPRAKSDPANAGPVARSSVNPVVIGAQATCGPGVQTPVAIGNEARALHHNSVALGAGSETSSVDQVAVGERDIEITSATKGIILRSPNGSRWRVTVSNVGALGATPL
jgi:hypothetical protein